MLDNKMQRRRWAGFAGVVFSLPLIHRDVLGGAITMVMPMTVYQWGYDAGKVAGLLFAVALFAVSLAPLSRPERPPG